MFVHRSSSFILTLTLCLSAATPALSQTLTADMACDAVVPKMLEFVATIPQIEAAFDTVYGKLPPADKARFDEARAKGKELTVASKEYRSAFLSACFQE